MRYQFTAKSSNTKTGPIPTTMTEKDSCPVTCSLRGNGCYAENFPLSLHWGRVATDGISEEELLMMIRGLPKGQRWRHNVAGDLPHNNGTVDHDKLQNLALAAHGKETILYTHHKLTRENAASFRIVRYAYGLNVNASCESIQTAETALDQGINAVVVMPHDTSSQTVKTERGSSVVICPATYKDNVTCASCGLCAKDRVSNRVIVAFPAHGARKKVATLQVA